MGSSVNEPLYWNHEIFPCQIIRYNRKYKKRHHLFLKIISCSNLSEIDCTCCEIMSSIYFLFWKYLYEITIFLWNVCAKDINNNSQHFTFCTFGPFLMLIEIFWSCIRIVITVLYLKSCWCQLGIWWSQVSILLALDYVSPCKTTLMYQYNIAAKFSVLTN